jgi:zinc and cadmium transporter
MQALALGLLFAGLSIGGLLLGAAAVTALTTVRHSLLHILVAFAAGTLLGAAFLGLMPEAVAERSPEAVGLLALAAVAAFFLLEKWVIWHHCHDEECDQHQVAGYLVLVGDGVHNVVDGVALGAAFVADPALGVTVGVAVLAHEIPQEIGDYALLLDGGLSRRRALAYNVLSASTIVPGVIVGYLLTEAIEQAVPVALALAMGAFLYVALADLIADLHRRGPPRAFGWQFTPMLAGVALIWLVGRLEA